MDHGYFKFRNNFILVFLLFLSIVFLYIILLTPYVQNSDLFVTEIYNGSKGFSGKTVDSRSVLREVPECLLNTTATGIDGCALNDTDDGIECKEVVKRFFTRNETKYMTALASVPGSGNTWVRHLIEEITGIYTGSIYNDTYLGEVFKGEGMKKGVIVIKTHKGWNVAEYDRVLLIVRDPFEAAIAESNRKKLKSHTAIMPKNEFNRAIFVKRLRGRIDRWLNFYESWLLSFPGPVFVLFYNKLKSDLRSSLYKLAFFLDIELSFKDLRCVTLRQEGSFHRPPKPEWMSRSNLVSTHIEDQIDRAKKRVADICKDPKNGNKIQTNM